MAIYAPPRAPGRSAGSQQPEPAAPIPGWRKLIALVGWGVPIAVLIALNLWGILLLAQGPPTSAPVTETTPTTAAPVVPPTQHRPMPTESTSTTTPTADTGTPTVDSPPPEAFPEVPSVIASPSPPALPTEITLPPGL
jgi:cytoskeletal protein RodZ